MCGITAIFRYSENAPPVDPSELEKIRDHMTHRGPDGAGLWVDEKKNVGLGHRRLSIIDLTGTGYQPMSTLDGTVRIVFNGEIYNYDNLRSELIKCGHQFVSTSDTEVILHLYLEKGVDFVHELRGMYAFVIWDTRKQGLFLARDPFGIKPLYFHDDGKTLRCASQVKALIAGGHINLQPEPAGHVGFYLWGCVPEPFTLYKNIIALPPGHTMWVDKDGVGTPRPFFNLSREFMLAEVQSSDDCQPYEAVISALRDSVSRHLVADVPVGVFLSSGLDSNIIAALASEKISNIHAITLGFDEYRGGLMDEVPLASTAALQYGYGHFIEHIRKNDFEQEFENIIHFMDQPTIDGVNTYFVSRAAAKAGLKVVLSGLGGDELLGSYPSFRDIPRIVRYAKTLSWIPGFGKTLRLFSSPIMKQLSSPKYAGLFEYGASYGGAYLLRRGLFMPWELFDFMDGGFLKDGWERLQPVLSMDELMDPEIVAHAKVSALELSLYMRNMLLRDSDWAGMAHSLEIRVPFVDVELFRILAPLILTRTAPSKKDLACALGNKIPASIINRPKTGFAVPVKNWLESSGLTGHARGLRGWARYLMGKFE